MKFFQHLNKLLFIIFLFFFLNALTKNTDSLVRINKIQFHSKIEKELYRQMLQTNDVTFDLLLLANKEIELEKRLRFKQNLDEVISNLKKSNVLKKSEKKQLKVILSTLESKYFKIQTDTTSFNQVFESGKYNSLSSTILQAYVLKELGIPFTVKYSDSFVFLNPYPKTKSTAPKDSLFVVITANSIVSHVETGSNELELISGSGDDLPLEELSNSKEGNLLTLVGLQYYNLGHLAFLNKNFRKAFNNYSKCFYLTDIKSVADQLYLSLANEFQSLSYKNPEKLRILIKLSSYKTYGINNSFIANSYNNFSQIFLKEEINPTDYENYSYELFEALPENLVEKLKKDFFLFQALYYQRKFEFKKSFSYAYQVLQLSNDENANKIFLYSLSKLEDIEENVLKMLDDIFLESPTIRDNDELLNAYIAIHFNEIRNALNYNNISQAETIITKLEKDVELEELDIRHTSQLAEICNTISLFYYIKKQFNKSLLIVNKGLKYNPENYELLKKKKALEKIITN